MKFLSKIAKIILAPFLILFLPLIDEELLIWFIVIPILIAIFCSVQWGIFSALIYIAYILLKGKEEF